MNLFIPFKHPKYFWQSYCCFLLMLLLMTACKKKENTFYNKQFKKTGTAAPAPVYAPAEDKGYISFGKSLNHNETVILHHSITPQLKKGYEVIDTAWADLDLDGKKDIIIIEGKKGEFNTLPSLTKNDKRIFNIFLQKENNFIRVVSNDKIILCRNCCGMSDPYGGIFAKAGMFSFIECCASFWKSITQYNFRYEKKSKTWFLDGYIHESYAGDFQHHEIDTVLRKEIKRISVGRFDTEKYSNY